MLTIALTGEFVDALHDEYFGCEEIEAAAEGLEVYVATDLMFVKGAYRYNAVYAFKSKTSVKSYEKYLKATGEDHKLIVTTTRVSDLDSSLNVITVFEMNDGLPEYKFTEVLSYYDEARDYKDNLKESNPSFRVEFDIAKIRSRFTPSILHAGWCMFL